MKAIPRKTAAPPITRHGLTYEQCSRLADAYVALMDCRAPLSAHLPTDILGRDPLERVIQAAKKLSEEEVIETTSELVK